MTLYYKQADYLKCTTKYCCCIIAKIMVFVIAKQQLPGLMAVTYYATVKRGRVVLTMPILNLVISVALEIVANH